MFRRRAEGQARHDGGPLSQPRRGQAGTGAARIRATMLVSGPGAERFAQLLRPLNAPVTVLDGPVGLAASRKLARSVFFKGLAAAVGEALEAAARLGPEAEAALREDIARTLAEADASTVDRLQEGSRLHAVRREEEMAAAAEMLRSLDLDPLMAEATRAWLARLAGRNEAPTA